MLGGRHGRPRPEAASSAATLPSGAAARTRSGRCAFGTPEEVYREVRERIEIFGPGGGFVFNTVHNVQATTPTENMLAMFRALKEG